MTNDEARMTKEARSTNDEAIIHSAFRHSTFVIPSTFELRHSSFHSSFVIPLAPAVRYGCSRGSCPSSPAT